jgi:hypothetical protein
VNAKILIPCDAITHADKDGSIAENFDRRNVAITLTAFRSVTHPPDVWRR